MAGSFDPNWRNNTKGTRAQFRLSNEALRPFNSSYPVHLTDVMDAVPSTQSDLRRADVVSPVRGTHTRAVREYEKTIDELRKENFDLKLRLFLIEETQKNNLRNRGSSSEEQENTVQVIVGLENDTLKTELSENNKILNETLNQVEKYANKISNLHTQISNLDQITVEKEKEIEDLRNQLSSRDNELHDITNQLEELSNQNVALEAKNKKSRLAIQGLAVKYCKEVQMIPPDLRPLVNAAVQAAKDDKANLSGALEELKKSLHQLRSKSTKENMGKSDQKENRDPSQRKTSFDDLFSASQSLGETSQSGQSETKTKFVHGSKEHSVDSLFDSKSSNRSSESLDEGIEQMIEILRENENLKGENLEKSQSVHHLNTTCSQLDLTVQRLQNQLLEAENNVKKLERRRAISSSSNVDTSAQTSLQGHLLQSSLSDISLENAGQSNSVDELKEENLTMLLVIEGKNKEISDLEQKLKSLQSDVSKDSFMSRDIDYVLERNDLHQRLAQSCSVNNELMDHLRRLEKFMEDLIHHKLDSSDLESEVSSFMNQLSTCLDETKRLSSVLYDNLSVCEGSKIFDPDETVSNEFDRSRIQGFIPENESQTSLNDTNSLDPQGRNNFSSFPESFKNQLGTGKRRLSFSSLHTTTNSIDPDNMVVVGTSNNEDLILVLNDRGDPEDVLIRNNKSHPSGKGDQLRRRCWDPMSGQFYNASQFQLNPDLGVSWNYCQSSDSDIWSEPDRDISLQRIGIDVQKSPTVQKSPRRSKLRRNVDETCTQKTESSSSMAKIHSWSNRRKSCDNSKASFTSKRSWAQSYKSDNQEELDTLHKTIDSLTKKCSNKENTLDETRKELQDKLDFISTLSNNNEELSNLINQLREDLQKERKEKDSISSTNLETNSRITTENEKLKSTLTLFEVKASKSDDDFKKLKTELEQTRERLEALDKKCANYEKELSDKAKSMEDYIKELRDADKKRHELLKEIDDLKDEKINLQSEFDRVKSSSSKEKEEAETEHKTLEKERNELSKTCQNLMEYLVKMEIVFLTNFKSLITVCQQHLDCGDIFDDMGGLLSSNSSNIDNPDKVKLMFDNFIFANTKFESTISFLSEQLHERCSLEKQSEMSKEELHSLKEQNSQLNGHLQKNLEQSKSLKSEYQSKILSLQEEINAKKNEILKVENAKEELKKHLEENKQVLSNKEESIDMLNMKNSTLESNLANIKGQLNTKDDEITRLQERIFNLQTQVNSLLPDKRAMDNQINTTSSEQAQGSSERSRKDSSHSERSRKGSSHSERAGNESNNTSVGSISVEKERELEQKECERHLKKIKALKAKISMMEKRIEILEKEKNDLRQELLAQGDRTPHEDFVKLRTEMEDLKKKLNDKTSFIKDLKNEMFRTCNSLVDKQKEVDDLKRKLSESTSHRSSLSKSLSADGSKHRLSDPFQLAIEDNIKMLKSHKWELIQAILDQQKQFYERKNIHLGHLEKFKKHIQELRSLQRHPSLSKAESDPFLNKPLPDNNASEKSDSTLEHLRIELELDVECLQNFKIFLTRFFVPLVLQSTQDDSKNLSSHTPTKNSSVQTKFPENDDKNWSRDHLQLNLLKHSAHTGAFFSHGASTSANRLATISAFVTHHLDMMERGFNGVKAELKQVGKSEYEGRDSPKRTEAISLLTKLSTELDNLEGKMDKVFHLNSLLKSLFSFEKTSPQSPYKQEWNNHESMLSEGTISRSGSLSPMSFEDHFPSKLVSSHKHEDGYTPQEGQKTTDSLSLGLSHQKSNAVGGSQDSLFQRSHFSSPDLGIESDPNRESSAPEQAGKEDFRSRMSRYDNASVEKQQTKSVYGSSVISTMSVSDALHAIGYLQHYELLKKEVQESLVGIKAILSRTNDGLQHVGRFTSPRKNLEYSTFKAIKDTSGNIEVCLKEAAKLVDSFWIAPCPSVTEFGNLIQMTQEQHEKLKNLQEQKTRQEKHFQDVIGKLKRAEVLRENMEKKISKKLLKTKKVLRRAEIKILECEKQDSSPIPKYPTEEPVAKTSYEK